MKIMGMEIRRVSKPTRPPKAKVRKMAHRRLQGLSESMKAVAANENINIDRLNKDILQAEDHRDIHASEVSEANMISTSLDEILIKLGNDTSQDIDGVEVISDNIPDAE